MLRELKNIARRLGPDVAVQARKVVPPQPASLSAALGDQSPQEAGLLLSHDQPVAQNADHGTPPPWLAETVVRDRPATPAPEPAEAAPAPKPRRNLLFSSMSRKERERAEARTSEPAADLRPRRRFPKPAKHRPPPSMTPGRNRNVPEQRMPAAAARRPRAVDVCGCRGRCGRSQSASAGRAKRGPAAGHGAQIGRRRWHGLFALFRRLDRGANARRHDAVRLDRRTARASRPSSLNAPLLPKEPA